MDEQKKKEVANALSGLSYREWTEVNQIVEANYHVVKKELTSEEISSLLDVRFR